MPRLARTLAAVAAAVFAACADEVRPRPFVPPDPPDEPAGVPHLTLSAEALHFAADEATPPPPQEVVLGNSGEGVLTLPLVGLGEFWVDVAVTPGASTYTLTVSVDPTGLAPGRHEAALMVMANDDNSPATVSIVLDVAAAEPGSVARVEVLSGGFLLVATGDGYRPLARAYDALGGYVNAAITWRSSAPEVVSFDPRGIAWAGVGRGASLVTAEAGGVTSPPVVAVVALPAPGTEVLGDDDVDGVPSPLEPSAPIGPGWRYDVDFLGEVPFPVGTRIVTRGRLPLAGRVVASRKGECGPSRATLEVVPLEELLPGLAFSIALPVGELAGAGEAGAPQPCAAGAASLTRSSIDASGLGVLVDYEGGLSELRLAGELVADVAAEVSLPAGFEGAFDCRAAPRVIRLPWPGALQLALPSRLSLGAGLVVSGAAAGPVSASPAVAVEATVDAGLHADGATAVAGGTYALEAAAELDPAPAGAAYRIELRPHVAAELAVWAEWSPASRAALFGLRAGARVEVDWAPEDEQAGAPVHRSAWSLAGFADLEPGEDALVGLGLAGPFTSIVVGAGLEVPLWRAATGTLTATPPRIAPGAAVELGVALDPLVAPPGLTPVGRVEIRRRTAGGLAPVCAIQAGAADPRAFACTAAFPDAVSGQVIELHAFAVDPGGALPTEVAGEATWVEVE